MALSVAWIALGLLFTVAGLPAVLTPFAQDVATVTGLPLETVLMTQVNGYATPVLSYQMGPLILGIAIGGIRPADGARIMLPLTRSEEHTPELQSLMRISYAVFCLKKKKT